MIRQFLIALGVIALGIGYQGVALALECPKLPEQTIKDWEVEVNAAVAKIGPVSGGELKTKTKNATQDILGKLPNADRVYLEQMLFATYCSALRDDKALLESQKAQRLNEYIGAVRKTIQQQTPKTKRATGAPPLKQPGIAPSLPVPDVGPAAPPHRAETCGPSLSTTIKPAIFVPQWVSVLNRMREERNIYDITNLMSVWGRTPVGRGGTELIDEALFTLNCLEKQGQLNMEKLDPPSFIGLVENKRIIFLKPMMTIPE